MSKIAPLTNEELDKAVEEVMAAEPLFACQPMTIRGVEYERSFVASNMSLRDLLAVKAHEFAGKECFVYNDERYTFADVWQKACQFANVLIDQYGVKPGDRIAIAMRNYPEWCISYIGIIATGASVLPLNAWWQAEELEYSLKDSGAKIVIGDKKRIEALKPLQDAMGLTLISAREKTDQADAAFEVLIDGASTDMPQVQIDPDSDFCILYTSGSTGKPKGVELTHRSVISAVLSWSLLLKAVTALRPEANPDPDNATVLLSLPLFHVTASHSAFLLSFLGGRRLVFMYRWDVADALRLIKKEKVTSLSMVPTQSFEVVEAAQPGDLDSLSSISTGGAKRPAHHVKAMVDKFPDVIPSSGYGLTETNALGSYNGMQDYVDRPDSTGRAIPPVTDIKIFDEEMNELPAGEVGEICIKSPATFRGYLGLPEETAKALTPDGWFKTGDLGKLDEDGFLYIVDRLKDLIIRGGENISCLEVENAIYHFPGVKEVTVFGLPDEKYGEIVGAVIYTGEKAFEFENLRAHLAEHLAAFKLPERMWLSPQQLPRGGTDKIDKRATRSFAVQFPAHFTA